ARRDGGGACSGKSSSVPSAQSRWPSQTAEGGRHWASGHWRWPGGQTQPWYGTHRPTAHRNSPGAQLGLQPVVGAVRDPQRGAQTPRDGGSGTIAMGHRPQPWGTNPQGWELREHHYGAQPPAVGHSPPAPTPVPCCFSTQHPHDAPHLPVTPKRCHGATMGPLTCLV
uniref:Uncharacterized protein n=1 Tax=Strix occidentalis caurina TaxID=311401 RepID=A0A8D0FRY8_STROC